MSSSILEKLIFAQPLQKMSCSLWRPNAHDCSRPPLQPPLLQARGTGKILISACNSFNSKTPHEYRIGAFLQYGTSDQYVRRSALKNHCRSPSTYLAT